VTIESVFSIGDWIVHNAYGIGQIKKIEKMKIHDKKVRAFRVKTKDSVYWVPIKKKENPRIRRVVDKRKLNKALRTLKSRPRKMDNNYKSRQARISEVFSSGTIQRMAKLLRDLLGLRDRKKWNMTEMDAVKKLLERFAREYAVIYEIPNEVAHNRLMEVITKKYDEIKI
jgi:RNA polymerase-interacting CarD/CdnL/TRCF family regulator